MYSLSQEASLTHMRPGMSMAIWRHSLHRGLETGFCWRAFVLEEPLEVKASAWPSATQELLCHFVMLILPIWLGPCNCDILTYNFLADNILRQIFCTKGTADFAWNWKCMKSRLIKKAGDMDWSGKSHMYCSRHEKSETIRENVNCCMRLH